MVSGQLEGELAGYTKKTPDVSAVYPDTPMGGGGS